MKPPKDPPIIKKTKGQTDRRIDSLSFKDFEAEFGFKPDDKIEQRHFANNGKRLTDPEERASLEFHDKRRKASAKARSQ